MIELQHQEDCMGCGACANICPKQCITLKADEEGFWYPHVDAQSCSRCGACQTVCPMTKPAKQNNANLKACAAISKNEPQRMRSSSGGVFSLLAEYVLEQRGAVFGAAFTEDFKSVRHIAIQSVGELWKLQGSKYLQSRIGDTYAQAKDVLRQGRPVLFTGTACQIAGLYSYLGRNYDLLYTQSVICHGVASPLVWEKYATFRESAAGQKLKAVSFREKKPSWKHYSMKLYFDNGAQYETQASEEPYLKCYIKNYTLRPACFDCRFKSDFDRSDLTLGDFWGIQYLLPEMNDDKGTSLVLVRSEKGKQLLDRLAPKLKTLEVDCHQALLGNPAAVRPVKRPGKRERFMAELRKESVQKVLTRYSQETPLTKVMSRLRWYRTKLMRKLKK